MAERDRQLEREEDATVEGGVGTGGTVDVDDLLKESSRSEAAEGGSRSCVREKARTVATGQSLAVSLGLVAAGALLVGGVLALGSVGNLLGIALGAFLYGVAAGRRHYTESTLAGVAVGGVLALLGNLVLSLTGIGVPLVAVGAVGGGLAGLVGHYFGRDLRDGLTREV
jgi:hypothetical protein